LKHPHLSCSRLLSLQVAAAVTLLSACADPGPSAAEIVAASVTISPDAATLSVGETRQLTASVLDANNAPLSGRTVTWSSSSNAVATVVGGLVTAISAGSATITAAVDGKTDIATIQVVIPAASISLDIPSLTIVAGETRTLVAVARDVSGNVLTGHTVQWQSSNTATATVNGSGVVTAVSTGTATITASSGSRSATSAILVAPSTASVSIAPASATIAVQGWLSLEGRARNESGTTIAGRAIEWSSSNVAVATVNASGLVTGVATGSATITASSGSRTAASVITVVNQVTEPMIVAGWNQGCALNRSGQAYCWGADIMRIYPVPVARNQTFKSIAGAFRRGCGIAVDGTVHCWLGDSAATPLGGGQTFTTIASSGVEDGVPGSYGHFLALATNGSVYAWGKNDKGQLGDGTRTDRATPTLISGSQVFTAIAAGDRFSMALNGAGQAYAWGLNTSVQLGTTTGPGDTIVTSPRLITGAPAFASIAAGYAHASGVTTSGELYAWGNVRGSGTSGIARMMDAYTHSATSAGMYATLGLTSSGAAYTLGFNGQGALGDGTTTNRTTPVRVATTATLTKARIGRGAGYGLATTGVLWGWGYHQIFETNSIAPQASPLPDLTLSVSPASASIQGTQTVTVTVTATRVGGGFFATGLSGAPREVDLSLVSVPAGIIASLSATHFPVVPIISRPAEQPTATLTLTATRGAVQGTSNVVVRARAAGVPDETITIPVTLTAATPPTGPGTTMTCTTESTPLPAGYQCLQAPSGELTVGTFGANVQELLGSWYDESAGLCITWQSNGQGRGKYYGGLLGGGTAETALGKWGVMVTSTGALYPNATQWYVFTATLDAQTKLLGYDSATGAIIGWAFRKVGSCPA
jgi:uncharacterized protein YjdB